MKQIKIVFFFYLLCGSFNLFAQVADKEKPLLEEVLSILEDRYAYTFNYAEKNVANIRLEIPDKKFTINEVLRFLEKKTHLRFTILDDLFISVTQPEGFLICGYVLDSDTGQPISDVLIRTENTFCSTDASGYFSFVLEDTSPKISFQHVGFTKVQVSASTFSSEECSTFYLIQQQESLSEIYLSSYLVKGISKKEDGSLHIDFSKFTLLPGLVESDVLQAVQAFPGIQSTNETVSNITIHGGTHDQNLILWDGIKMYQSGHFFGLISVFNPEITEQVSIVKNGTPVQYSDGVSGMISMKTSEEVTHKLSASAGVTLINAAVFADIPVTKNSSLQLAARHALNDVVATPTYEQYFSRISQDTEVENNENTVINSDKNFSFYDVSLRWLYHLSDKDLLRVNFITIDNELLFNENARIGNEERSRQSSLTQNSIGGGLFYKRKWSTAFETSLQVYETDYTLRAINVNLADAQRYLQENIVSETGATLQADYRMNNTFNWSNGYQFIETEVTNLNDVDTPRFKELRSQVVRTHSAFSSLHYKGAKNKTHVTLGVRYNFLDKFKEHLWEPRINVSHHITSAVSLEVLGELKHQVTSQVINFQNDFLGIEKRRWQVANNEDIPIIRSKKGSIGINYSKKGWLVSTEGYYKVVEGITSQSQGFQNQFEFIKTSGSYNVKGIDVLVKKELKNTTLWGSYSYMDNQYLFKMLSVEEFPSNYNITHALNLGATYTYKQLKLSAGCNWRTGNPTTLPVAGNEVVDDAINYAAPNNSTLADYLRIDASVLYSFNIDVVKFTAGASVWNLTNKENNINAYYKVNQNGMAQQFLQNSLELTPNALVRVSF